MASSKLEDVQRIVGEQSGADASNFTPRLISDAVNKLEQDVLTLRANPLLRPGTIVQGAIYDVDTGRVNFQ